MQTKINRRQALGAAAAAVAVFGPEPGVSAATGQPPNPPESGGGDGGRSSLPDLRRLLALPGVSVDEQAIFHPGIALVAGSGGSSGASLVYNSNPAAGGYPSSVSGWVGIGLAVPFGSVITGVDFVIAGSARGGLVLVERYLPDTVGFETGLFSQSVAPGSGPLTISANLSEFYDGTQAYHAYHFGGTAASVCRGIRVRYIPPTTGFVPLPPTRVYDSRLNMAPDAAGALATGASRTITAINGRDINTGLVNDPGVVPSDATAIAYTVTLAGTSGAGYLAVNPGGQTVAAASSINWWQAGQVMANTSMVPLGPAGTITVVCGGSSGSAQFIIDVVGYFAV